MRFLASFVLVSVSASPSSAQTPTVIIDRVNVVDVEAGKVLPARTVVIQGNRITRVTESGKAAAGGARVIDGQGKYLIPGLWDMHVHAVTEWLGKYFLPLLVANGVTGVRDMFTTSEAVAAWRSRIAAGEPAPRVGTFGALVDGDPPIWQGSVVAKTPADGRRIVDSLRATGIGFVKVYSRLDPETFAAIADQSGKDGLTFAGHIPSLVKAADAARLGQRTVEHLTQVLLACSKREDEFLAQSLAAYQSAKRWDSVGTIGRGRVQALLESYDSARCEQVADQFVRAGTYMVPTIAVLHSVAYLDDTTLAADSRLKYIPGFLKTGWNPKSDFRFKMLTAEDWALRKKLHARELEVLSLFRRKGVKMLVGTDLANPYVYPGWSVHDELASFVALGMKPIDALRAATLEPARFLGATDSLGTIGSGKVADLVLLDGNPLADIGAVARISVVVADGRVYDAAARAKLLEAQVTKAP